MKWIKLHTDEWLNSTMRFTLNHKQRAVWADFLALGGKSRVPGIICAGEENGALIGLPPARIAGVVDVPPEELSEILKVFESQERVTTEVENGRLIIRLCNWSKYQSEYDRQKKYRQPSKRVTGKSDAKLHGKLQNATAKSDSLEAEVEVEREVDKNTTEPSAHGVCEQIVSRWNTECSPFAEVLKLTEGRRRKILARIRADAEFPDKLLAAVSKAKQTPFLCGSGARGWKADFDWFIANDTNYVAVLEGKYSEGKGGINADQRTRDNLRAAGLLPN